MDIRRVLFIIPSSVIDELAVKCVSYVIGESSTMHVKWENRKMVVFVFCEQTFSLRQRPEPNFGMTKSSTNHDGSVLPCSKYV